MDEALDNQVYNNFDNNRDKDDQKDKVTNYKIIDEILNYDTRPI